MRIVDTVGMRAAESAAITSGVPGYVLMKRAGEAAAQMISALMHKYGFSRIVFLCGGGNNAGDALVSAALLYGQFPIRLWALRALDTLKGEAAEAAAEMPEKLRSDIALFPERPDIRRGDLVVDGLLGIGLRGEVRRELSEVIAAVNSTAVPVLALDVPSGMDSDTGEGKCPNGEAVHARWTLTFGMPKKGLFSPSGIGFSGMLRVADIGLAAFVPEPSDGPVAYTAYEAFRALPRYAADIHKNRRGGLLVMAGSRRYPGAAGLAALAGLRGGAGIVRAFYPAGSKIVFPQAVIPVELPAGRGGSYVACPDWSELPADALVAGPGWSDDVTPEALSGVLDFPGKLLLDADALNLLARHPELWRKRAADTVLTPHPGEAERLRRAWGLPAAADRRTLAAELAVRSGAAVVLKGARTVTADPNGECSFNTSGSPDLATAGSGDALSGLVGAFLANGMSGYDAARLGAFIHGAAGEFCGRSCIADDLPKSFGDVMTHLENGTVF